MIEDLIALDDTGRFWLAHSLPDWLVWCLSLGCSGSRLPWYDRSLPAVVIISPSSSSSYNVALSRYSLTFPVSFHTYNVSLCVSGASRISTLMPCSEFEYAAIRGRDPASSSPQSNVDGAPYSRSASRSQGIQASAKMKVVGVKIWLTACFLPSLAYVSPRKPVGLLSYFRPQIVSFPNPPSAISSHPPPQCLPSPS